MYQFAFVFEGHGQCHRSGGYNFVFAACQFVFVSICVCVWRTWSVLSIRWTKDVITAYQVSDALASFNFISESISNSLKLLSWKGKCAKVLNNCWVCISRTAMATSVSTSLSGWWRGEPTTTAYAFKLINQLLQSFQTKPLLQMGPAGRRALRLSFCRWKIWKDQGVQRFRHRGGSSRGFSSFRSRGQRIHNNNRSGRGLWLVMTHLCLFVAILNYHEQTDWVLTCDKSLSSVPFHTQLLNCQWLWCDEPSFPKCASA